MLALASPSAIAQSYEQALAGFAADSFGDTDAAITAVAASGNPLAVTVIGALQDGRLLFDPEAKKVYVREASGKILDAATGQPIAGAGAGRSQDRASQQSPAPLGRGRDRQSDAAGAGPEPAPRGRAGRVQVARCHGAARRSRGRLAKETEARVKKVMLEARAAIILTQPSVERSRQGGSRRRHPRAQRPGCARTARRPARGSASPRCRRRRPRRHRGHRSAPRPLADGAAPLVRPLARLRAAARRHRARHHLRRHGRHQHGARRDGDAGRLHHLRGAGD